MSLSWHDIIGDEKEQEYFKKILAYVQDRRKAGIEVYPPAPDVFNAFRFTNLDNLKVVIIGQDPYHGPNQAHGLCFSVNDGIPLPPSLKNIFQELKNEYGQDFNIPASGCLKSWAEQGVFLLNNTLTVERGAPQSHAKIGWDIFTDHVIQKINDNLEHVVFMLWGAPAQKKCKCVNTSKHLVLQTAHPSPLSAYRGFFGCNHFIMCNEYLRQNGKEIINWQI